MIEFDRICRIKYKRERFLFTNSSLTFDVWCHFVGEVAGNNRRQPATNDSPDYCKKCSLSLYKSLDLFFSIFSIITCLFIISLFAVVNKLQLICSFHSTLFMGSVGSIFLSQFGWHSVFIFHGLVALLWAYLWKFHIVLPEQLQKREQLALGNIKMVEASSSERAHMLSVPWGAFSRHPAVW